MDKEVVQSMRKAVISGDLVLVKDLLNQHEGLLHEMTCFGTWLHVASKHGQLDIVKFMLENGLDVNQHGGISDSDAISDAAFKGHLEIVQYLFENGAQFDLSNTKRNPLFSAIYNNHFEVAKFLIDNGIDIMAVYGKAGTYDLDAYEYARQYGRTEIKEYLKEILIKTDYFVKRRKEHNPLVNR